MSGISYELLAGSLASISIFTIWLFAFHKKFIISIVNTRKVNTLGIYTDFGEALRTHFWYLLKAKILPGYREPDREALEDQGCNSIHLKMSDKLVTKIQFEKEICINY